MSAREAELAEIQAAERQSSTAFEGSRARKNHVGTGVGVVWNAEVEDAVKSLVAGEGGNLLILVRSILESGCIGVTEILSGDRIGVRRR